jgi:hypothetical protein
LWSGRLAGLAVGVLALLVPGARPTVAQQIIVAPQTASVAPGELLEIPILVDMSNAQGLNIASLQVEVGWNAAHLQYEGFDQSELPGSWTGIANEANVGGGSFAWAGFSPTGMTSSFVAVTLVFRGIAADGTTTAVCVEVTAAGDEAGVELLPVIPTPQCVTDICIGVSGTWGDVNADGAVNIIDAQQIGRYSVGLPPPPDPLLVAEFCDVTQDGVCNIIDAQQVARYAVGLSMCPTCIPGQAKPGCEAGCALDTDEDRLPDCVETNTGVFVSELETGTNPNDPDTDDDAILDGDEVLGTLLGLDLPLMGVSPLRKDILLEYDWFDEALECGVHSHRPTAAALAMGTATFANAPVTNPDGSTGINFIHDYGQGGVFTGGNLIADADGVLTGGVNSAEFQNHKSANFNSNRHGYFHYVILPHRYNTTSSSSGQAELPGDDMIVSLHCAGSDRNVGHTIVHELGHNLILRHGGFENNNWKPNYNSVMNYKYQFPGIDNNCTPPGDGVLDYSVGVRPPLDENNLDETQGVCGNPPGPGWDWNGDGDALDVGFAFDINVDRDGIGDGVFGILQDYNDWAFLILTGIGDADGDRLARREIISCLNPAPVEGR